MTLRFAATCRIRMEAGPDQAKLTWGTYTVAALINRSSNDYPTICGTCTSGLARIADFGVEDTATGNKLYWYDGSNYIDSGAVTCPTGDGWTVVGVGKTSGNNTPRFHKHRLSSGAPSHGNGSNPTVDVAAPGATGFFDIGNVGSETNDFPGDIAAVAYWDRLFTDSEFERLAAGLWERWTPVLLVETRFGGSQPGGKVMDIGRLRSARENTRAGLTRSPVAGPPGFRFSPQNHRR